MKNSLIDKGSILKRRNWLKASLASSMRVLWGFLAVCIKLAGAAEPPCHAAWGVHPAQTPLTSLARQEQHCQTQQSHKDQRGSMAI